MRFGLWKVFIAEPLFRSFCKPCAEFAGFIFQLNFTTSSDYSWNRLNWIFAADNASPGTAYQRIRSTKAFHDLFRGTYPGDPRYDATFLTRWYDVKNGSSYHLISDSVYTYPYKTYKTKSTSRVADAVAYIPYDQMDDPTNPTVEELTVLQEQFYTENTTTGEKNVVNLVGQFATSVGDHAGWPLWKKQIDFNCQRNRATTISIAPLCRFFVANGRCV